MGHPTALPEHFYIANISTCPWLACAQHAAHLPNLNFLSYVLRRYNVPAARQLQGMESTSRSPVFTKFSEALTGVASIMAFHRQGHFTKVRRGCLPQSCGPRKPLCGLGRPQTKACVAV